MRRSCLVFFLILSLCQGFWLDGQVLFPRQANQGRDEIKEAAPAERVLCNPRPMLRFAQMLATDEQPLYQPRSHRLVTPQQPKTEWLPISRGKNRRSDDPIHPSEWGLIFSQYPRSDG